jgi:GxxExxY protein
MSLKSLLPCSTGKAQFLLIKNKLYTTQIFELFDLRLRFMTSSAAGFFNRSIKRLLNWNFWIAIPFRPQVETPVFYKGRKLKAPYRADFVCYDTIIVELKALAKLGEIEWAQVLNYLKASTHERGLLINFGARSLAHRRFVALEKAKRAIALRAETATLESDVRNAIHILTHEASKATTELEKAELRRQHQRLRGALAGHV